MPYDRRAYLEQQDSGSSYGVPEVPEEMDPYAINPEDYAVDPYQPQTFQGRGSELFAGLEGMRLPQARSIGEGLLYGGLQGLGSAGTRVAQQRSQFQESEAERKKAYDAERRAASKDLREDTGAARRARLKDKADERKANQKYMDETMLLTATDLKDHPELARVANPDGRIRKDWYRDAVKAAKPDKTLKQIEDEARARAKGAREGAPPLTGGATNARVTAQQVQAQNFLDRATQANALATNLEDKGVRASRLTGKIPLIGVPLEQFQGDPERQYWQTVRQFVESHLRKESGAAITDTELETAAKTYFAQPGDSKALIDQKRAARQAVITGLGRYAAVGSAESRATSGGARNKQELQAVKESAIRSALRGNVDAVEAYIQANPDLDNDPEIEAALDEAGVPR